MLIFDGLSYLSDSFVYLLDGLSYLFDSFRYLLDGYDVTPTDINIYKIRKVDDNIYYSSMSTTPTT